MGICFGKDKKTSSANESEGEKIAELNESTSDNKLQDNESEKIETVKEIENTSTTNSPPDEWDLIKECKLLIENGDLNTANTKLKGFDVKSRSDISLVMEFHYLNAQLLYKMKDFDNAIKEIEKFNDEISDFSTLKNISFTINDVIFTMAKFYFTRAGFMLQKKQFNDAMENYNSVLQLMDKFENKRKNELLFMLYNNRGVTFKNKKMFNYAVHDFKQAIVHAPKEIGVMVNLMNTFAEMKNKKNVYEVYKKALEVEKQEYLITNSYGAFLFTIGSYNEAIEQFELSLKYNPSYDQSKFNLDAAKKKLEDDNTVEEDVEEEEEEDLEEEEEEGKDDNGVNEEEEEGEGFVIDDSEILGGEENKGNDLKYERCEERKIGMIDKMRLKSFSSGSFDGNKEIKSIISKRVFKIDFKNVILKSVNDIYGTKDSIFKGTWYNINVFFQSFPIGLGLHKLVFEEFQKEAMLYMNIKHENLLKVYGFCLKKSHIGVFCESFQFGSLVGFLSRNNSILLTDKLKIVHGISRGMSHLHSLNILHKDLKCSNIFLSLGKNGLIPKIFDFGLSNIVEKMSVTKSMYLATQQSRAPELRNNNNINEYFSSKSDVYSFGILMYKCLCYTVDDFDSERKGKKNEEFEIKWKKLKKVPKWCVSIIKRCVDNSPSKRPEFSEICDVFMKANVPIVKSIINKNVKEPIIIKIRCLNDGYGDVSDHLFHGLSVKEMNEFIKNVVIKQDNVKNLIVNIERNDKYVEIKEDIQVYSLMENETIAFSYEKEVKDDEEEEEEDEMEVVEDDSNMDMFDFESKEKERNDKIEMAKSIKEEIDKLIEMEKSVINENKLKQKSSLYFSVKELMKEMNVFKESIETSLKIKVVMDANFLNTIKDEVKNCFRLLESFSKEKVVIKQKKVIMQKSDFLSNLFRSKGAKDKNDRKLGTFIDLDETDNLALSNFQSRSNIRNKLFDLNFKRDVEVVGRFVNFNIINNGSWIYKCIWKSTNNLSVAFKPIMLSRILQYSSSSLDHSFYFSHFLDKTKKFFELNCPQLLKFYCCTVNVPYIGLLFESVDFGDLETFLKSNPTLDLVKRLQLLYQISLGMEYLHSQDIIHSNLKLRDVMIDHSLDAKILYFSEKDFKLNLTQHSIKNDRIFSTLFKAPEIVYKLEKHTRSSDVFSFGVIAYILFTNNFYPWGKETVVPNNPKRNKIKILKRKDLTNEIKKKLIVLINKCWNHNVSKRPSFFRIREEIEFLISTTEMKKEEEAKKSIYSARNLKKSNKKFDITKLSGVNLVSVNQNPQVSEIFECFKRGFTDRSEEFIEFKKKFIEKCPKKIRKLFDINFEDIQLDAFLEEGGSGASVYAGRWKGRKIALKSFQSQMFLHLNEASGFLKEVEIFLKTKHKNILKFYRIVLEEEQFGLVIEFAEMGDLHRVISKNPDLPFEHRIRICYEIAQSLEYFHSLGLVHRDIKLKNILMGKGLVPKLTDFGLSRAVTKSIMKTMHIGTLHYQAPELVQERVLKGYTNKVDVFAYAIMMYQIITGTFNPFKYLMVGNPDVLVAVEIAKNPNFRPNLNVKALKGKEWIKNLLEKGWAAKPRDRPSFKAIVEIFEKEVGEIIVKNEKESVKK